MPPVPSNSASPDSITHLGNIFTKFRINRRHLHFFHLREDQTLSWRIKLSFCAPTLSTLPVVLLLAVYATAFYEKLGADLAYMSFFIALARSFDVMSDPLMSYWTDSTRSQYGRRRPFMLSGCWFYSILLVALLVPPRLEPFGLSCYFGVFYIAFFLASTYTNIPYDALGPELTDDYDDRSRLFFVSGLFDGFGALLAIMFPVLATQYIQLTRACPDVFASCYELGQSCYAPAGSSVFHSYNIQKELVEFPPGAFQDVMCESLFSNTTTTTTDIINPLVNYCVCALECEQTCKLENERQGFLYAGIFFSAWYCLAMVNCVAQIRERCQLLHDAPTSGATSSSSIAPDTESTNRSEDKPPTPKSTPHTQHKFNLAPPLVPSILNTLNNEPFLKLLPAWACDAVVNGIISSMMVFYVRYVIQPEYSRDCRNNSKSWKCNSQMVLGASITLLLLVAFISTPIWLQINARLGKRKAWLLWSLSMACTNIFYIFLGPGDVLPCLVITGLNGFPFGAKFIADAILSDIIDYDEFLTGARSEATYTMFKSFLPKICAIPAAALPIALLNVLGHVRPVNGVIQIQPPVISLYVRFVTVILPTLLSLVACRIKWTYPIKTIDDVHAIAHGIDCHLHQNSALDPISKCHVRYIPSTADQLPEIYRLGYFPKVAFLKDLIVAEKQNYPTTSVVNPVIQYQARRVRIQLGLSIVSLVVCTLLTWATFGWLKNPKLSVFPIVIIIAVGLSSTALAFCYLRHQAIKDLAKRLPELLILELALEQRQNVAQTFKRQYSQQQSS